jgi:sporulation protein YlmC with PRC-barrel domain
MNHPSMRAALTAASSLENATVVDRDGEDVGQIEDVLVLARGGGVAYAVVAYGNLFDQGFRHVAVPWTALAVAANGDRIVLDVDPEVLEDAPSFVKDGWPTDVDDAWMADLHRHYGLATRERGPSSGGPR